MPSTNTQNHSGSSVAQLQSDEIRLRTLRDQIHNKHEADMRELQKKNGDDVERVTERSLETIQNLKSAYDVSISKEAESLQTRLEQVRENNETRIQVEKTTGEDEAKKVRENYATQIKATRKTGDEKIEAIRKEVQAQADFLHDKKIKMDRAEKKSDLKQASSSKNS